MKNLEIRKGLCIILAAVMTLAAGGCGGSTGQSATGEAAEQAVQDVSDPVSANQETSTTSDVSSTSGNEEESSAVSSDKQENPVSSEMPSAGDMARDALPATETEETEENAQISVTVEEEADGTISLEVEDDSLELPADMPSTFTFSSGAGGWSTDISLGTDGTFVGGYHDSDMGTSDDDYPNGTVYYCNFSGRLEIVQKLDEYSYALKLASLEKEKSKEFIEDGIRYVPSEAYGMEKGKNYILYLPDTPLDGLNEEFLMWWPGRYDMQDQQRATLGYYGLYNQDMEYGFFGEVTGE